MDVKLVSKKNMGIIMIFILLILLSQSHLFNYFINTHLGRIVLISFIILTGYVNKILGLVCVLFIIIAFNVHGNNMIYNYNYFEGFDVSGNKVEMIKQDVSKNNVKKEINTIDVNDKLKGREGFCITDRETNMLRGKQSNSIPVLNNLREQTDDINPSDNYIFKGEYASIQ